MNQLRKFRANGLALLVILVSTLFTGCVSLAGYDQRAYENATTWKAKTIGAINAFGADCKFSIEAKRKLSIGLEAAFEYANGVQHNNEASSNWRMLIDNIVKGYFDRCKNQSGKINEFAFEEYKPQLAEAFDQIICLEANKRKRTKCNELNSQ